MKWANSYLYKIISGSGILFFADFLEKQLRLGHQRVIRVVNDESRRSTGHFPDMLSLNVVDLHLLVLPALGVVSGQGAGLLKYVVGQLFSLRLYNDVGAGNALCVEPPVAAIRQLEGEFVVLVVVLADVDVKSV